MKFNSAAVILARSLSDSTLSLRLAMKHYMQKKITDQKIDLTFEMLQVLIFLWERGEVNQQQIADKLQKNKASLTSLIDNLSKRNLVERQEDPVDRRNKSVVLTSEGLAYQALFKPILDEFYQALNKDMATGELEKLVGTLKRVIKNLETE